MVNNGDDPLPRVTPPRRIEIEDNAWIDADPTSASSNSAWGSRALIAARYPELIRRIETDWENIRPMRPPNMRIREPNDVSVVSTTAPGLCMLDTGCAEAVGGRTWHRDFQRELTRMNRAFYREDMMIITSSDLGSQYTQPPGGFTQTSVSLARISSFAWGR